MEEAGIGDVGEEAHAHKKLQRIPKPGNQEPRWRHS
jgi:hypothetical protein